MTTILCPEKNGRYTPRLCTAHSTNRYVTLVAMTAVMEVAATAVKAVELHHDH